METIIALSIGITLSAACGFRIFIPPLIMSIAANYGNFPLSPSFEWLATQMALITLAAATIIEIGAYYIPWLDNLLDTISIPTALAIGTMLTAASLGEVDPVLKWSLAAIAGGGSAGIVEAFTSIARLGSSTLTAGLGNPIVSTIEALSATVLSILALLAPVVAIVVVILVLFFAVQKLSRFVLKKRRDKT